MSDGSIVRPNPVRSPSIPLAPIPLFESRKAIHPKAVRGFYRRLKTGTQTILLASFLLVPLVRWERGGGAPSQAVLIDLAAPRAFLFGIEIWPQEIYYLTGLLILAALGLFLATALAGRVWCGFTCPQTVWTDLFLWIEHACEGDRAARLRNDRAPWTVRKLVRKAAKHAGWLGVSLATGFGFVAYFTDAPALLCGLAALEAPGTAAGFLALFAGMTYLMAGWTREQMCKYMCPWPRFQSAMLDEHSLVVTYRADRGDVRGPKRKSQGWDDRRAQGFGDCIDCGQCVQVCPIGIDVRSGAQADCINCGLCVDACDGIMAQQGLPPRLITFDSLAAQASRADDRPHAWRPVRPRTILYGLMMLVVGGAMAWSFALRPRLDITVLRDRAPLFVALSDGGIRNAYTFKVINKTRQTRAYDLAVDGPAGAVVAVVGEEDGHPGRTGRAGPVLSAAPDSVATYRVHVTAPRAAVTAASLPLLFQLTDTANADRDHHASMFLGPSSGP